MGSGLATYEQRGGVLPLGRRVPRGRSRWYLVACPEGHELQTCAMVKRIVPAELLEDAFVPLKERQGKYQGEWRRDVIVFFQGYFIVVTKDAARLSKALDKLTFPAHMVGSVGQSYQPISEDAQHLLEQMMDQSHVVRLSWGEVVSGALHVQEGPLAGKEDRVERFVRRKCFAFVRVGESDNAAFTLRIPLAILARR